MFLHSSPCITAPSEGGGRVGECLRVRQMRGNLLISQVQKSMLPTRAGKAQLRKGPLSHPTSILYCIGQGAVISVMVVIVVVTPLLCKDMFLHTGCPKKED